MEKRAIEFTSGVNTNSVGSLLSSLNKLPSSECELLLLISSGGGSNEAARAAYSALVNLPCNIKLTTCGCGTIDSAAVSFFCAGKTRLCLPHTRFFLHQATWHINETVDLRRATEIQSILKSDDESHAVIISNALSKTKTEVAKFIEEGVTWNSESAKEIGLVHEITDAQPHLLNERKVERIFNVT